MLFGNIRYFLLYPQDLSDNVLGCTACYIGLVHIADALDIFVYYYKRKAVIIYYDNLFISLNYI